MKTLPLLALALCLLPSCGDSLPDDPIERRVRELLARMSLDDKMAQMHGEQLSTIAGSWRTPDDDKLPMPGFRMIDGPRGVASVAGAATAFPVGSARGATFDAELEARVGEAVGEETRAKGGNMILAPTVNVLRHPAWGRAQESYGEDSYHLGVMGTGFVRGAQKQVIASAKHFAANSIEDTRFEVDVSVEERTLREIYLPHFRKVVDAGVGSVMSAYNKVNGAYCAENRHLIGDILKDEWGFTGFVESDWVLGTRSTTPSALAGLDVEMPTEAFYGDALKAAVKSGAVPDSAIDDAVSRILRAKIRFGIADGLAALDPSLVESAAHRALALEVARKSIVLLRNSAAALPLERASLSSLAVVGSLADVANLGDTGSSRVVPSLTVSPLAGIEENRAGALPLVSIGSDTPTAGELAMIGAASAAVVIVGLTSNDEGEGGIAAGDRKTLALSAAHEKLIADVVAANPRTIVVLEAGSAITMEGWADTVPAILMAWYPGSEGGHAIADVLFGDVNPSGKLPVTFARSADQLPPFIHDKLAVSYGYYHGYHHVDRESLDPRFPFGFGGSYTTFAFSNFSLDTSALPAAATLHATVMVTNTGSRAGDEVVQLYLGPENSPVDRPLRTLMGFQRVSLLAGESKMVTLAVPACDLSRYDPAASQWIVDPIPFVASVGNSSRARPLEARFTTTAATDCAR